MWDRGSRVHLSSEGAHVSGQGRPGTLHCALARYLRSGRKLVGVGATSKASCMPGSGARHARGQPQQCEQCGDGTWHSAVPEGREPGCPSMSTGHHRVRFSSQPSVKSQLDRQRDGRGSWPGVDPWGLDRSGRDLARRSNQQSLWYQSCLRRVQSS